MAERTRRPDANAHRRRLRRAPYLRGMRVATLEGLAVLAVGVVVLNAVADDLGEAAMACDGRSGAEVLLALARRRRVKALETQGRVAALLDAYIARLHAG